MLIEITDKTHPDMHGFQFCLRAKFRGGKDHRIHINHLAIKDGCALMTDGARIHRYKLSKEYDDGLYRIFKATKSHIILYKTDLPIKDNYPELDNLFKIKEPFDAISGHFDELGYIHGLTKIIRLLPISNTINPGFLRDLGDTFDAKLSENEDSILFENGAMTAAIMLMKT